MHIASVPVAVGIDVAKATLSVHLFSLEGKETALTLRNIEADINEKLLPLLHNAKGKVVLEATSHYHWLVTLILTERGHEVYVVNPLLAKQYTAGNVRKVKTDPADARSLARMARVADNLPPVFEETRDTLAMRKKIGCIARLTDQIQSLRSMVHQLKESHAILGIPMSKGERALERTLTTLRRQKKALENEVTLSVSFPARDHLDTIPGVTPFVATACLAFFRYRPQQTAKSWIGFAGLDISSRESGTWKGRCKLTKRGNSFLRHRLFSAAWGAVMGNAEFKEYYAFLRKEGRPHVEALLIIARRIVRIMFKLVEKNEAYEVSLLHAPKVALSTAPAC